MTLDVSFISKMTKLLARDESRRPCGRLVDDAHRLWNRVRKLIELNVAGKEVDAEALELACWSIQLPLRDLDAITPAKFGRINLRERAEQAAELLVSHFTEQLDEKLLDRTTRLLNEAPQKSPKLPEARLLADAINLDDFGLIGLFTGAIATATQGHGLDIVLEGCEKRDAYGYWDARLREGFHYPHSLQLAHSRLRTARQCIEQLRKELNEDSPNTPA